MNPAQLRAALPRTWDALLARHPAPNQVQLEAAPPLLAGRDVLICAPTAAGKTEAYLAPLCELRCSAPQGEEEAPPQLLLVSPTRALANDLHRRIRGPLSRAGIAVGRWTGDHHDRGRLQQVTVLTPESLDSRLSRAREALRSVRAVVLDELHVLDRTARGDQLRILLQRLRHRQQVQLAAASATVADPQGMAARYLCDAQVVTVGERRRVLARIAEAAGPAAVAGQLRNEVSRGFRKLLAFANSREDVEEHVRCLRGRPPFGSAVFAHHGSLARAERLRVERQFLSRPVALCVATSTLELGIDIGDIDLVVMLGAPASVASLMQRTGRGGRRSEGNALLALAKSPFEELVYRQMLLAHGRGELLAAPYSFRPGVLVQQAVSLLHENPGRWVSAAALQARLPAELRQYWTLERVERVLDAAERDGWLFGSGRRRSLGERGERRWARGTLHANLSEKTVVQVSDAMTGDVIGEVANLEGLGLGLSGRGRSVLASDDARVVTRASGTAELARFGGGARPPVSAPLARCLLEAADIPAPSKAWRDPCAIFHGLGSAGGALLGAVFKLQGAKLVRAGPLAVLLREPPEIWPGPASVDQGLQRHHAGMAAALGMGAFHGQLPEEEQRAAVAAAVDAQALRELLLRGPPDKATSPYIEDAAWW